MKNGKRNNLSIKKRHSLRNAGIIDADGHVRETTSRFRLSQAEFPSACAFSS